MPDSNHLIGAVQISLERVDSTNTYAKGLLSSVPQPAEGSLVLAAEQTAGRGQAGSMWQSGPGQNFTGSYILYPSFLQADKQFFLNMAVSLAVRELCEELSGQEIRIKWPNDIYAGSKKLAGILIENTVAGGQITASVVGIGLNVNQTRFDKALPNPVSLQMLSGHNTELQYVIDLLNAYLEKYYLQLRQQHFNFLDKAYTVYLYRYNQTALYSRNGIRFKGEISGVTKEGKLIIDSQGKEYRFGFKEVEYL